MLDPARMTTPPPGLIADLNSLQERLRNLEAGQAPDTLAQAAGAVRALIAALGISQGGLARELGGVNEKTVRDWCAAKAAPGPPAVRAMRLLAERLVASPTPDMAMSAGRVASCEKALAPHLAMLAEQAGIAGWQPGEIAAAMTAWAVGYTHQA